MIFIFGGAFQGKTDFARSLINDDAIQIYTCTGEERSLPSATIITHIERFHLSCVKRSEDAIGYWETNLSLFRDSIIIADDISCGVVPIDATERAWCELAGSANQELAHMAERVYRVFCGLGARLK